MYTDSVPIAQEVTTPSSIPTSQWVAETTATETQPPTIIPKLTTSAAKVLSK